MLKEGEQRLVRPVQVFEHQDGRVGLGDPLQESAPGGEQLLPLRARGRLDPQQGQQPLPEPLPFLPLRQDGGELVLRHNRRIRLQDACVGLQDLSQRPERDPLPIRQAPPLPPSDQVRPGVDVRTQLGHDPALAQSRLTHDRYQLHRVGGNGLFEDALQERQVDLPTDERAVMGAGQIRAEPRSRRLGVEHPHRLCLPLQGGGLQFRVVEHGRGRLIRCKTNRHTHLRGHRLQPGGGVDCIPRQKPFP